MKHKSIAVALITVLLCMVFGNSIACTTPVTEYALTISSTEGGSVTTPGEGTYTYYEVGMVNLVATPDAGYRFVNWTGDVGTIADVNSATTTITMNGYYSITANFGEAREYDLTISSTTGGSVTTPGEGTFTYFSGTGVNLVATPDDANRFANWTGDVNTIADVNAATTTITMNGNYSITANFGVTTMVSARSDYTVGLKADGTVVAAGSGEQFDASNWTDIVQVAAGVGHMVGVKSDGTAVAVGWNSDGQCDIGGWTGIVQVAAGAYHTVGLKADGTVVAVGHNGDGRCNVSGWMSITQVATGTQYTVGLKADGTVVAVGANLYGRCDVSGWTGITRVAAGVRHTVGLKADGTVVAVGNNDDGQCNVGGWTGITQVAAGYAHTVGLSSDGTVVAVGRNDHGQCNISGWDLTP